MIVSIIHEYAHDILPLMFSTSTFETTAPKSMFDSAGVEMGVTVILEAIAMVSLEEFL